MLLVGGWDATNPECGAILRRGTIPIPAPLEATRSPSRRQGPSTRVRADLVRFGRHRPLRTAGACGRWSREHTARLISRQGASGGLDLGLLGSGSASLGALGQHFGDALHSAALVELFDCRDLARHAVERRL